ELAMKLEHERDLDGAGVAFGLDFQDKRRRASLSVSEVDTDEEGAALPPYEDFDVFASRIEERRLDPYLMFDGDRGSLQWEAGLRYEMTDADIHHDGNTYRQDYGLLLPSAHLRWAMSDADRLSLSLARSLRRPNFNHLDPTLLEGEFGDNDFIGNPLLAPETANGIDLGFEHRIGARGIIGVNVFYRDVSDLIELVNTGEPSDEAIGDYEDDVEEFLDDNPGADENSPGYPEFDPDSFVYTAANVGDGEVYGIEFDVSMPLTAFGLENTGVFANASWLDSRVDDAIGERRFNDQARYVYNLGFIHSFDEAGVSFGASYRKQGAAESRVLAEEVRTEYGADLEAFVEKRFGEKLVLRLTGSNLLDASKDEFFDKFDTLADQIDRDYDEYELETERSGRVWQLMLRYAF
ncbi:MAG TPA: TonB-dependent receptor, partial [Arenimonas sp.]|nr:TonB-dependent receptor [Arenimonas sp.]